MTIPLNFHVIGHRINTGMAGLAKALSYLHIYRKLSLYGTFMQEGYNQRNFMVSTLSNFYIYTICTHDNNFFGGNSVLALRSLYIATFDYQQTQTPMCINTANHFKTYQ